MFPTATPVTPDQLVCHGPDNDEAHSSVATVPVCKPLFQLARAFSPWRDYVRVPGALPQAGIERAVGAG